MFFLRGLVVDVANQRRIQQRFGFLPEGVPAFAVPFGVGDQSRDQFQNVLFIVDIRKRVVFHGLFEVDGIQDLDAVAIALQHLSRFNYQSAFRVLSIRIEKKSIIFLRLQCRIE